MDMQETQLSLKMEAGMENSDNLIKRVLDSIKENRDRILQGKINSISSPFVRFRRDFLGIQQKKYYLVTGSTKAAKTQIASYLFIYKPLMDAYEHPDKLRLKIFYYPLEETKEDVTLRFMSHLLLRYDNISISTDDLQSVREGKMVNERIISLLESEKYQKILRFFESTIEWSDSANPTGVYRECKKYAEEHGKVYYKKVKIKNDIGDLVEVNKFDYYVADDPEEYKIIFVDHTSLLQLEKNYNLKQTIDKLSEYFVTLRNRYKFSPVLIQQQALAGEGLDAIKMNQLRPTIANLSDSKYTARDKPQIHIFVLFIYISI